MSYYEYSLTTHLNFQAGDMLGIFQPDMGRNRLRVYFLSGVGPRNYYETLASNDIVEPPSDMFTLGEEYENDLPLVAVEISKFMFYSCIHLEICIADVWMSYHAHPCTDVHY